MRSVTKARDLLKQGITAYMEGKFSIAAKKTEAARNLFERANTQHDLANCENFLGNIYKQGETLTRSSSIRSGL